MEEQDDFTLHDPPPDEQVKRYEIDNEGGPDAGNLRMAMRSTLKSHWNKRVANIVLDAIRKGQAEGTAWNALPEHSNDYFLDLIFDQMERAKTARGRAQPKLKEDGEVEMPVEVEQRMIAQREAEESRARVYTRRSAVSPWADFLGGNIDVNNRNISGVSKFLQRWSTSGWRMIPAASTSRLRNGS